MKRSVTHNVFVALGAALAVYTQLVQLTWVPGLHFDEAWQANFAVRIASEHGFWPTQAMNSYTSPVVHYLLAAAFRVFGPTLETLRGTYAVMNLVSLALLASLMWRVAGKLAAGWLVLLWALLPLSVHDHRFYVELTGFHGFCLAALLWGLATWRSRPRLSFAIVTAAFLAGAMSHILFIAYFTAAFLVMARHFPEDFRAPRARALVAAVALLLLPLPVRMGAGLGKTLPFALALALAALAAWALAAGWFPRARRFWDGSPAIAGRILPWLIVPAIPFLIGFTGLLWNGFWPYAQATGKLTLVWLPLNAVMFAALWFPLASIRKPDLWRNAFLASFVAASALILKQGPRYYMVPAILGMAWMAIELSRRQWAARHALPLAVLFACWNLWAFEMEYLGGYRGRGPTTEELRLGFYHDNARDFRPFQKVFSWIVSRDCQRELRWVEDDRFGNPIDFLRLSAPPPAGQCPWSRDDLFLSHIPDYDPSFKGKRTDANTPPPVANVKFLAHDPEWGDLALWIRR